MKFSSHLMDLRTLSLLALLNLVLATPKLSRWSVSGLIGVIKTLGSFAAGTVPGLVQLRADNMNPSIDCSVVPLHIPLQTEESKKSEDKPLRAMIL